VLTPDGQRIILPSDRDMNSASPNILAMLDIKSDAKMFFYGHSDNILCTAVTPDGRQAISGSLNGEIIVWDLEMPTFWRPRDWERILDIWGANKPPVWRSKFKKFFLKFLDWSLSRDTGVGLRRLTGHTKAVTTLMVTPDGRTVISGSVDKMVKVWDLSTGKCIRTYVGHNNAITALAVTPDGQKLLSTGSDHILKVWDLDRGDCLHTIEGLPDRTFPLVVSPDGQLAIWGAGNKNLIVWNLRTEQIMTSFTANDVITGIIFASDGLTINAGSDRIYCLFLENCTPGVPILTAWQSVNKDSGLPSNAFGCPFCRTWSEAPMSVLGTIIACPSCGRLVKLNPFTIDADWRPIARVWKEYE
jgi:WD40 repeat protein